MQERSANRTEGFVVTTGTAHDVNGYYSIQVDARGTNFTNTLYDIAEKLLAGELDNARHSLERLWSLKKEAQSASNAIVDELIRHYEGKMSTLRTREERVLRVGDKSRSLLSEKQRSDKELAAIRKQVEECMSAMAELQERLSKLHQRENELASAAARISKELSANEREVLGALHDIVATSERREPTAGEGDGAGAGKGQPGSAQQTALIVAPRASHVDGKLTKADSPTPTQPSAENEGKKPSDGHAASSAAPAKQAGRQEPSGASPVARAQSGALQAAGMQSGVTKPANRQSSEPRPSDTPPPLPPEAVLQAQHDRVSKASSAARSAGTQQHAGKGTVESRSSDGGRTDADTPPPLPPEATRQAQPARGPKKTSATESTAKELHAGGIKDKGKGKSSDGSGDTPDTPPPLPPEVTPRAQSDHESTEAPAAKPTAGKQHAGGSKEENKSSDKSAGTPDMPPPLPRNAAGQTGSTGQQEGSAAVKEPDSDEKSAGEPGDTRSPEERSVAGQSDEPPALDAEDTHVSSEQEPSSEKDDFDDDTAVLQIAAGKTAGVRPRQGKETTDENGGAVALNTAQEPGQLAKSVVKTTSERVLAEYLYDPSVDKSSRHYILSSRYLLEQLVLGVEMLRTDYDRENHAELVQMLQDSCNRVVQLPNLHFEMSTADIVNRDSLQDLGRKLRSKDYDAVMAFCGRLQGKLDALGPNYRRMLVAQMDKLVGRTSTRR